MHVRHALPESLGEEVQEELRQYDAYLAKTLDPDDPSGAQFLDRVKVAGKIAGKVARAGGTAYLVLHLMGCIEPTITPHVTGAPKQTATETFIPTPTETIQTNYQAEVIDITALIEKPPTPDNSIKSDYEVWLAEANEIPDLPDPRIWKIQFKSNGTNPEETLVLAQSQYTHDTYILNIVSGEGASAQSTRMNSQLFAEAVMGQGGAYQNVEYYYKDQTGNKVDVLTYDQQKGKFVYTKLDGQKEELDGLGIYFGKTEDPSTGGKLLSLVPPGEDFYKTLPEGAIVNMETKKILDASGSLLYHFEYERWQKPVTFESGPSLEFSPLFPAEWHKEFTGQVEGMDVPIIIGLSTGAKHDTIHNPPMSLAGVWMTQEGTNAVADAFLRAAHYRYTKVMGNDVTYEEYLDILKNQPHGGEVNLLITDNELGIDGKHVRREALIDPRQGFSMLITDKIDLKFGVKMSPAGSVFFGVDGNGRLLFASDNFSHFDLSKERIYLGTQIQDEAFVFNNFSILLHFASVENRCMISGNSWNACGQGVSPPENLGWWQAYVELTKKMEANGKWENSWGLVKY